MNEYQPHSRDTSQRRNTRPGSNVLENNSSELRPSVNFVQSSAAPDTNKQMQNRNIHTIFISTIEARQYKTHIQSSNNSQGNPS